MKIRPHLRGLWELALLGGLSTALLALVVLA